MLCNAAPVISLFMCVVALGNGAKILGIFHHPSPSHHILGSTLLKELAKRGHEVTMISPYPSKDQIKNYMDIGLPEMLIYKNEAMKKMETNRNQTLFQIFKMMNGTARSSEIVFENKDVLKLINSKDVHFDLVITVIAMSDAMFSFGHHFQAPIIALSTLGSGFINNYVTANSAPYAYVPNLMIPLGDKMTFFERVTNTIANLATNYLVYYLLPSYQNEILIKHMPKSPSVEALRKNISLVLLNSHYSIETPRPIVPSMVQIGGFHVQAPKEITGELKEYLDAAKDGVIYFSLGSNIKSADLKKEKLDAILKVFSKLPQKILWKWEEQEMTGKPSNVKLGKWLPQRDILAHPNVKAFITHGGLLSTIEAVYNGVPVIGIPFFGDQQSNVKNSEKAGFCIELELEDLDENTFSNAINEILYNPVYRNNINKRSELMKDQPIKPLDNAVFWVEHILKHKGGEHLRTAAMDLTWYQLLLVDVIGSILGILGATTVVLYFVIKNLIKLLLRLLKTLMNTDKTKKIKRN